MVWQPIGNFKQTGEIIFMKLRLISLRRPEQNLCRQIHRSSLSEEMPPHLETITGNISASRAWRISEESFMKDQDFQDLKSRAGYGVTGNSLDLTQLKSPHGTSAPFITRKFHQLY
ncbi:hypothetical protein CS542_06010 [Pedobacter sp. IW39]|nr:hypothetical protein CS542_06010 [Pedobacter sp. IW39]